MLHDYKDIVNLADNYSAENKAMVVATHDNGETEVVISGDLISMMVGVTRIIHRIHKKMGVPIEILIGSMQEILNGEVSEAKTLINGEVRTEPDIQKMLNDAYEENNLLRQTIDALEKQIKQKEIRISMLVSTIDKARSEADKKAKALTKEIKSLEADLRRMEKYNERIDEE